jgi:tRNA(Ile)-lysidine synthase
MALVRESAKRASAEARDFDHRAVVRTLAWASQPKVGKRLSLPGDLVLVDEGELLILRQGGLARDFPEYPQLESAAPALQTVPFEVRLRNGWRLRGRKARGPRRSRNVAKTTARFPAGSGRRIVVRSIASGDRIDLGRGASGKVADLFVNRHIPRAARALWPVVEIDGEVAWVVGLRQSAKRRRGSAKNDVELVLEPPGEEGEA